MACEHEMEVLRAGDSIICIENLSFAYRTGAPILQGVNLSIPAGRITGLLGPNGCGKSTLFRCCMNFLKPSHGRVELLGKNVTDFSPSHLAQHVAYVPQEHKLPFPFTVREMVAMGRSPHLGKIPVLSAHDRQIIDHVMEKMKLHHLSSQHYSDLSGGQRQLVLVARAMAQQAALIFLDEPTSSLDFANQMTVWEALIPIAEEGVGVFICSHDPNHILWFCDEVIVMRNGQVLTQGIPQNVMTSELLQEVYNRPISMKTIEEQSFIYLKKSATDKQEEHRVA